jgi:hypothetical protein
MSDFRHSKELQLLRGKAHHLVTRLLVSIPRRTDDEQLYDIGVLSELRRTIGCIWCGSEEVLHDHYCGKDVCSMISGRNSK